MASLPVSPCVLPNSGARAALRCQRAVLMLVLVLVLVLVLQEPSCVLHGRIIVM